MIPYKNISESQFMLQDKEQPFLFGEKSLKRKLLIGLPRWTNKLLYPKKTKPAEMLEHYAKHFKTIELNSSHYSIPSLDQIRKWKEKVPTDFLFCPKFPKSLSHTVMTLDDARKIETNKFFDSVHGLQENLGPSFMQMIEFFDVEKGKDLLNYLSWISADENVFVEVRHESWFQREEVQKRFSERLNAIGKGWVITDTPGRRDAVHLHLPIPKTMIRFVCSGDERIDKFRISEWKKVLTTWFDHGLEECYFILHVSNPELEANFYSFIKNEFELFANS